VGTIPAGLASRRLDRPLQTHPNDLLAGTRRESTERGRAFGCMLQGVFACLLLIAAAEIVRLLAR